MVLADAAADLLQKLFGHVVLADAKAGFPGADVVAEMVDG